MSLQKALYLSMIISFSNLKRKYLSIKGIKNNFLYFVSKGNFWYNLAYKFININYKFIFIGFLK